MLAHKSGVIGFPLRLLAREVYDRVVARRGPGDVALITGEEKIVPPKARFYLCTVESMPLDWGADFLAVDEIQLCADPERGHVFTNRLLSARGRIETLFLGSESIRERIAALLPGARFEHRDRLSTLSYAGSKKISRMPTRSAIVAFSVDNVYAIAELLRRQKGGAAVVMGALSPRTRNAQVALYQEGEVDFLVATDAIGMGLNLDLRHVAFAGLAKFDGRRHRRLDAQELAQIAGRAGRHKEDGAFGVTGEAPPLDAEIVSAIEEHRFRSVGRLQWRNAVLDYATPQNLLASLERDPGSEHLARAREAEDVAALRALCRDETVQARAKGRSQVKLLWEVCQVPDFRKTMPAEHAALLAQLYRFLSSEAAVAPEDWFAAQCDRLDRTEGDIDALSKRLAYIRTWTYVANRSRWLDDPGHWRERTRAIEDRLSDALHERLTQRFVDRRTSVLARRLKQKERLVATVDDKGSVTVEGEFVGRIEGFRFQADPSAASDEAKTLQAAGASALQEEFARRVQTFYSAPDAEIALTEQGGLMWGDAAVGRLKAKELAREGADPMAVRAAPFADEMIEPALQEKIERRLQFWIDRKIEAVFEPLIKLRDDPAITGLARGVAYQLIERLGVIPRNEIADQIKALDQEARRPLRAHQVRFGQHTVFIPALLKPAPTRLRLILWGLAEELPEIPSPPPPGHVTIPAAAEAPKRYYAMAGYHRAGPRAIRLDMLERLADLIRPLDARGGFEASPEMLSLTGATLEQFAEMMEGLGYRAERGERPKAAKTKQDQEPTAPTTTEAAPEADASSSAEAAAPEAETIGVDAAAADLIGAAAASTPEAADAQSAPAKDGAAALDPAAGAPTPEAGAAPEEPVSEPPNHSADVLAASSSDAHSADAAALPEDGAAPKALGDLTIEPPETRAAEAAPDTPTNETTGETTGDAAEMALDRQTPTPDASPQDEPATASEDAAAPSGETEVFYIFTLQPRGRRGRDEARGEAGPRRRGKRGAQGRGEAEAGRQGVKRDGGDARGQEAKAQEGRGQEGRGQEGRGKDGRGQDGRGNGGRGNGGRGQETRGEGRPGGKRKGGRDDKGGRGGRPPQEISSGPPRRGAKIDPDSPFAILQKLKDRE
ncbi:MAG: helicase-related protein [Pseudomonadota bacterium]